MCQNCRMTPLGLTDDMVPCGTHVCIVYSTDRERDDSLLKFIQSGIKSGERVACFSNNAKPDMLRNFLSAYGLAYDELVSRKTVMLSGTSDVYFKDHKFSPDRMLSLLSAYHQESLDLGYPASRVIGEMTPEVQKIPGGDRLMEYESRVSQLLRTHPVTAVCQYDARSFDGATIMDVLKVHPQMIVDGSLVKNPFFIEPEVYLQNRI